MESKKVNKDKIKITFFGLYFCFKNNISPVTIQRVFKGFEFRSPFSFEIVDRSLIMF